MKLIIIKVPQKSINILILPSKSNIFIKYSSPTPVKLFQGVPNLISPIKEGQDIYNNSPIKMGINLGSPLESKFIHA